MQPTIVNAVETEISDDVISQETDDCDEPIEVQLYKFDVPNDSFSKSVFHTYAAAVHQISNKPTLANEPECIVCGHKHRFDKCPTLQNVEFLRSHYIRYCQFLKRDSMAKTSSTNRSPSKINFIESEPGLDTDYDTDEDFQTGRA